MSQADDLRNTQLLVELSGRLITESDTSVLYDEVLKTAIALTKADAGTLQLLDPDTNEVVFLTTQGFDDPDPDDADGSLRLHIDAGCLSAQATPLVTRAGKVIGMVSTHWREHHHRPADRELRFLDLLARHAADLIDRKRAHAALQATNEQLESRVGERSFELSQVNETLLAEVNERRTAEARVKKLLRQLVHAQEEERRRIARELHDTLGQQLAALHMSIELIKSKVGGEVSLRDDVERMRQIFDRVNSDVDFLAWQLRPPTLDLLGIDAALETFVREWGQQFGIDVGYETVGMAGTRLGPEVEINLYRIFQEALQNIHKHADATRVNVLLERHDGHAILVIEDNGKGYAEHEGPGDDKGMGLTNMQERAALVGGRVEVESEPDGGTTVFVRVPITETSPKELE
jgi:signal transduction histidine kinase